MWSGPSLLSRQLIEHFLHSCCGSARQPRPKHSRSLLLQADWVDVETSEALQSSSDPRTAGDGGGQAIPALSGTALVSGEGK